MEFIKALEETNETKELRKMMPFDEDFTIRKFKPIRFDNFILSVQAGFHYYCTPRKTLRNLNDYEEMEFAILRGNGNFLRVLDVLPDFSKLSEIEKYWDTVYAYVPVDLINDLYNELKSKYGR